MNKLTLVLALGMAVQPLAAGEEPTPIKALGAGKATVELRTRWENVDDAAAKKTADAITNRFTLSWRSGAWKGVSAFAQFENVAVLSGPRYFVPQTGYGLSTRATVVDPQLSQLNQLYLEWKGLKVGRQLLNLDNQRFFGGVGWRQNDQTFTGASYTNATLIPKTDFTLAHFTKAHTITGVTKAFKADLINFRVKAFPGDNIRAFHYMVEEELAPATSLTHTGARLDGEAWKVLLYDISVAKQKKYKDATDTGTKEVGYTMFSLGWKINADHSLSVAQETLEGGFRTPYATLHAWNGWADRFLATPVNGLKDQFISYKAKRGPWNYELKHHTYKAETNGAAYGRELDLVVEYKVNAWLKLMAKAADYKADAATPTIGTGNKDLRKFWLQTTINF
jgi:hypothetical protein